MNEEESSADTDYYIKILVKEPRRKRKQCCVCDLPASSGLSVRTVCIKGDFSGIEWQKEAIMRLFAGH